MNAIENQVRKLVKVELDAALRPVSREQVEKVWRGEWIDKRILSGAPSECSKCGYWVFENLQDMEFCPHCGAPMTDEAVECLQRRWEDLRVASKNSCGGHIRLQRP